MKYKNITMEKEHCNFRLLRTSGEWWRSLTYHLKLVRNKIKNITKEKQLWLGFRNSVVPLSAPATFHMFLEISGGQY